MVGFGVSQLCVYCLFSICRHFFLIISAIKIQNLPKLALKQHLFKYGNVQNSVCINVVISTPQFERNKTKSPPFRDSAVATSYFTFSKVPFFLLRWNDVWIFNWILGSFPVAYLVLLLNSMLSFSVLWVFRLLHFFKVSFFLQQTTLTLKMELTNALQWSWIVRKGCA